MSTTDLEHVLKHNTNSHNARGNKSFFFRVHHRSSTVLETASITFASGFGVIREHVATEVGEFRNIGTNCVGRKQVGRWRRWEECAEEAALFCWLTCQSD
jgi:hypothetical protein